MKTILNALNNYWEEQPALLYGLSILLGFGIALTENLVLIVPIIILCLSRKRIFLVMPLAAISALFIQTDISLPSLSHEGLQGTAHFEISSITTKTSHMGKQYIYKGVIKSLFPFKAIKNVPVAISVPMKGDLIRPVGDKAYLIEGTLFQLSDYRYHFSLEKNSAWQPVDNSFSLAEYRHIAKRWVSKTIKAKIEDEESGTFLAGMVTGEFDDRLMAFHFSRFGLQHIMAISGFHFALIAGMLSFALQFFLSKKNAAFFLMALLTLYFLFLGFGPSILRAWLMILIALSASILRRPHSCLNALGLALILCLIIDPLMITNLGFQFSFAVTAAILMFYSEIDRFLQNLFPKRFLFQSAEMKFLDQHGFIFLTFIRQALSLTFAVNLLAIPLMLYHFEQFPILSLIYNFFFPFMVSISMLLLLLGIFFPFIDILNSHFTKFVLGFAYNMPQTVDYKFYYSSISFEALILYFSAWLCLAIFLHALSKKREEDSLDFAYL